MSLNRRDFIKTGFLASVATTLPLQAKEVTQDPNVIYIFPDQWRKYAVGFWSKEKYKKYLATTPDPVYTPHLDALAEESVVFTNAIANQPLCSPMRGMLLSGRWPAENGLVTNCRSDHPETELNPDLTCMPDIFSAAGYNTAYFGKCHWYGTRKEFDEKRTWVGKSGSKHYRNGSYIYDTFVPPGKHRHGLQYLFQTLGDDHYKTVIYEDDDRDSKPVVQMNNSGNFSTRTEMDQILKYLSGKAGNFDPDRPLYMMWAPNPPHPKFDGPDEWIKNKKPRYGSMSFEQTFKRKNVRAKDNGRWAIGNGDKQKTLKTAHEYFGMVSEVDNQIGRLLTYLKTTDDPRNPGKKLEDNTILVITSDHGEMLNSQACKGKNKIFRESVEIPLIIRWPKKIKPRVEQSFFNIVDHLPTVAGLAGIPHLIPKSVRGSNLAELCKTGRSDLCQKGALFVKQENKRGIITDKYTLLINRKAPAKEQQEAYSIPYLYDNVTDPYQMNCLQIGDIPRAERKELISDLLSLLEKAHDSWSEDQVFKAWAKKIA